MLEKVKLLMSRKRISDELLYEAVMEEINSGKVRQGLWGKALSESKGDQLLTQSMYIKLRVESLKDEYSLAEAQNLELEKQATQA